MKDRSKNVGSPLFFMRRPRSKHPPFFDFFRLFIFGKLISAGVTHAPAARTALTGNAIRPLYTMCYTPATQTSTIYNTNETDLKHDVNTFAAKMIKKEAYGCKCDTINTKTKSDKTT